MSNEETSTRRQILELLKRRGEMTAAQMGETIGITSMGVRQHLSRLERDGLVATVIIRQKRGRPTCKFVLTEQAEALFPARYGQIAVELLEQIVEMNGAEQIDRLFERRMTGLERQYRAVMGRLPLDERVDRLARIREDEGYMAEAGTDEEGAYTLVEHHCPIYEIAKRFPQACQYEQALFAHTLETDVRRIEHKIAGDGRCRYVVRS